MIQNRFIFKRKGSSLLPFLLLFIGVLPPIHAQTNLSGKPGLMYIPSATETEDGTLRFGYNYNPIKYGLRYNGKNPERILFANLTLFKRLDVNLNFLQGIDTKDRKIKDALGDRQLDLRYLVLKETAKRPSLAIVLSSPFTIDAAMMTQAVVATKNITLSPNFSLGITAGYGSPYYVYRKVGNLQNYNILSGYKWQKKSEDKYKNNYLSGPFGGFNLNFRKTVGLMVEYDANNINVGLYGHLFKCWTVQAGVINADQITFGTSYSISLLKPSKRLAKLHETSN
jgi:hypothetical protein